MNHLLNKQRGLNKPRLLRDCKKLFKKYKNKKGVLNSLSLCKLGAQQKQKQVYSLWIECLREEHPAAKTDLGEKVASHYSHSAYWITLVD